MRKILYLCAFVALCSCTIEYDGETRLVSETRLVDTNGNPIANKEIQILVRDNDLSDTISNGKTDENGKAVFVFPAPNDIDANIDIVIQLYGGEFGEKQFKNIKRANFTDYKYTLNNVVLYKNEEITHLELFPVQANPGNTLSEISLIDNPAEAFVKINSDEEIEYPETYFQVVKNSNVTLRYVVTNNNVNPATNTVHTELISIGNENITYQINY